MLLAFLAANRLRAVSRDELVDALWPGAADGGLAPLLSKLRKIVPVSGTTLALPAGSWIDLEAASEALHRAEAAVARRAWADAWAPARVTIHVAGRGFLPGEDAGWVDGVRRHLHDLRVRALECAAAAGLALGESELPGAARSARMLVELEPYRESGYRLLMETLERQGNPAEALRAYEALRSRLRTELGVTPSEAAQALHRRLLG